jgi:hypothetical protein
MYTKERLNQFADWMENQGEFEHHEDNETVAGAVLSSISKNGQLENDLKLDNLSAKSLIGIFRIKIERIKFDNLGICKKEDEKMIFAGFEKWRRKYESALKSTRKEDEQRVSGWW